MMTALIQEVCDEDILQVVEAAETDNSPAFYLMNVAQLKEELKKCNLPVGG
jgi:hypothetical protein